MITITEVRELLSYDPISGELWWLKNPQTRKSPGRLAGQTDTKGYRRVVIRGRVYGGHRLAWLLMTGQWPDGLIDHKNLNTTDNRWENLRIATPTQNNANCALTSRNTTGLKGVTWHKKCCRWQASIKENGKNHYLGLFDTAEAAHAAYAAAAEQRFGEFARVA